MSRKRYETESHNVFRDIGVPNPEEHLVKAQLVFRIDGIMKKRGLKQIEAADLLGIRQPDVSRCCAGNSASFPWSVFCVFWWRSIRTSRSW